MKWRLPTANTYIINYYTWRASTQTLPARRAQQAGTARTLNTADPTTAPTPRSPSVTKVPTQFMNSSGLELAAAMNVAPATSDSISSPITTVLILVLEFGFQIQVMFTL